MQLFAQYYTAKVWKNTSYVYVMVSRGWILIAAWKCERFSPVVSFSQKGLSGIMKTEY